MKCAKDCYENLDNWVMIDESINYHMYIRSNTEGSAYMECEQQWQCEQQQR